MALIDDFKARFPEIDTAIVDAKLPIYEPVIHCYYGGPYIGCGIEITLNLIAHLISTVTNETTGWGQTARRRLNSGSARQRKFPAAGGPIGLSG